MAKNSLDNPKNIFILDALGALVSILLLGGVLVHFENYFGIPKNTLYILASCPIIFVVYDLICFYFIHNQLDKHLKLVATLNLLYILLSISLAYFHTDSITWLGYIYIIGEIIILLALVLFEWKMSNTIK
ncbi:MAG: hypothetical protein ACPGVH_07130 [Chitinophagales bacterium]